MPGIGAMILKSGQRKHPGKAGFGAETWSWGEIESRGILGKNVVGSGQCGRRWVNLARGEEVKGVGGRSHRILQSISKTLLLLKVRWKATGRLWERKWHDLTYVLDDLFWLLGLRLDGQKQGAQMRGYYHNPDKRWYFNLYSNICAFSYIIISPIFF